MGAGMTATGHLYMPEDHMHRLYNSKNPLVRWIHTTRLSMIVKELPKQKKLDILDAGCGEGHLLQALHAREKNNHYAGIDVTAAALKKARKRCPFAMFKLDDITTLEQTRQKFDLIICTEVLEHVYEYRKAINALQRSLKEDGQLIITFPNEWLWTFGRLLLLRRPVKVPDHINTFTPKRMLAEVRLTIITKKSIPLPLPFFLSLGCLMKFKKESRKSKRP